MPESAPVTIARFGWCGRVMVLSSLRCRPPGRAVGVPDRYRDPAQPNSPVGVECGAARLRSPAVTRPTCRRGPGQRLRWPGPLLDVVPPTGFEPALPP